MKGYQSERKLNCLITIKRKSLSKYSTQILFTQLNAFLFYIVRGTVFLTGPRDYTGPQTSHQVIMQWRWKTHVCERISIRKEVKQFDYNKKEIIFKI